MKPKKAFSVFIPAINANIIPERKTNSTKKNLTSPTLVI